MCFTATGSFASGAILVISGCYTIAEAKKRDRNFLLLASLPLLFGIQQLLEGIIWIALGNGNKGLVILASHTYVFFAFALWPFYSPLSVYVAERVTNIEIKRLLWALILIGFVIGTVSYMPILTGSVDLVTKVVNHSISYDTNRPEIFKGTYVFLYLMAVIIPFLVVSDVKMKIFGLMLTASVVLSDAVFNYAFVSVWCFFAAILSLYLIYVVKTLPAPSASTPSVS